MRELLKFQRKNGNYSITNYQKQWESRNGVHYVCYPFQIYKADGKWKLTHISSGAMICSTAYLHGAKYIATRLLPLPQWLLPESTLVEHMTADQKAFCIDIISRYRDETKDSISKLDKNCPLTI